MEVGPVLETDVAQAGVLALRDVLGDLDIQSFDRRLNGSPLLLRQGFFERLLRRDVDFASCPASDLVAAQADIRHLTLPQLLRIRCDNLDFTASTSAQAQSKFLSCVDERIEQCILTRLEGSSGLVPRLLCALKLVPHKVHDFVHQVLLIYGVHANHITQDREECKSSKWLVRFENVSAILCLSTCELCDSDGVDIPTYCHLNLSRGSAAVPKAKRRLHWHVELSRSPDSQPIAPDQPRRRRVSNLQRKAATASSQAGTAASHPDAVPDASGGEDVTGFPERLESTSTLSSSGCLDLEELPSEEPCISGVLEELSENVLPQSLEADNQADGDKRCVSELQEECNDDVLLESGTLSSEVYNQADAAEPILETSSAVTDAPESPTGDECCCHKSTEDATLSAQFTQDTGLGAITSGDSSASSSSSPRDLQCDRQPPKHHANATLHETGSPKPSELGIASTACSSPRSGSGTSYVSALEEELRTLRAQLAASEEARRCLECQVSAATSTGKQSVVDGGLEDAVETVEVVPSDRFYGDDSEGDNMFGPMHAAFSMCMSDCEGDDREVGTGSDLEELFEFRDAELPKAELKGTTFLMNCSKDSRYQAKGKTEKPRKSMKLFKLPLRFKRGSSKKAGADTQVAAPRA